MKMYRKLLVLWLVCVLCLCACTVEEKVESAEQEHSSSQTEVSEEQKPDVDYLLKDIFRTEEPLPDYDMQNEFARFRQICESESAYYFLPMEGRYLHYYDKVTGNSGVLCGKPECMHNTNECNAHIGQTRGLCFYDGKIHWVENNFGTYGLFSMTTDGLNREQVDTIESEIMGSNVLIRLHRGYIYVARLETEVTGAAAKPYIIVQQERLGAPEGEEIRTVYKQEFESGRDFFIQALGNTLYLVINEINISTKESKILIYEYDIKTDILKMTAEEVANEYTVSDFYISDTGKGLISAYNAWGQADSYKVWEYDLAKKEIKQIYDEKIEGRSLVPHVHSQHMVAIAAGTKPHYLVSDFEGNVVKEGDIPMLPGQDGMTFRHMGGTESYALVILGAWNSVDPDAMLLMIPFDPAEEMKILWTNT